MSQKRLVAMNGSLAGLGNRIRFTLSAYAIAQTEGRKFSYTWPTDAKAFQPELTELWNFTGTHAPVGSVAPTLLERPSRIGASFPKPLTELRGMPDWAIHGNHPIILGGGERSWEALLRELKPVPAIRSEVESIRNQLPAEYVGVQVRAHSLSHHDSLELSPVAWYISRMQAIQENNPQVRFFLSCDDLTATRRICDSIPHVFTLPEKGAYNSVRGVQASIVDLYVLSSARLILGPAASSFVELAWALGGRRQPLETSIAFHQENSQGVVLGSVSTSRYYVRPLMLRLAERVKPRLRALLPAADDHASPDR